MSNLAQGIKKRLALSLETPMEESREIQTHLKMAIVKLCQLTLIALLRKQLAPRDKFKSRYI